MALSFSQADIVRFKNQADRISAKAKAALARAGEAVGTVINTAEVGAASFLFGLAQGKYGGIAIVGVPVDLLAGVGLHVLAFSGVVGRNADHVHAFGDGALASYLNGLGRQVGRSIQTDTDRARIARSGVAGQIDAGVTGGASLADEELARMVAAGRR